MTASCAEIADTQDRNEKNEIFVETLVSSVAGGAGGYFVGLFLISNPVGWGTAKQQGHAVRRDKSVEDWR